MGYGVVTVVVAHSNYPDDYIMITCSWTHNEWEMYWRYSPDTESKMAAE